MRSHIGWRGEQNILYKGVETSPPRGLVCRTWPILSKRRLAGFHIKESFIPILEGYQISFPTRKKNVDCYPTLGLYFVNQP